MKFLNKNKLTVTALLVGTIFTSSVVNADGGKIEFSGNIVSETCNIVDADKLQHVRLGNVNTNEFDGIGSYSEPRNFSIELEHCPESIQRGSITFNGAKSDVNNGLLAVNPGDDAASNVGVALFDERYGSNQMELGMPQNIHFQTSTGKRKFDFTARYQATGEHVTPGTANATANFDIQYQ